LWGRRVTGHYRAVKDWPATEEFISGERNVKLADTQLLIKLGIMTNFMMVSDKFSGETATFLPKFKKIKVPLLIPK
jgi:hypothetical protein